MANPSQISNSNKSWLAVSFNKILIAFGIATLGASLSYADVTRYPLPNGSTFPIAQAVEVTADTNSTTSVQRTCISRRLKN